MSDKSKPRIGKGKTNLSGARGASPVLRVRLPAALMESATQKAKRSGVALPDVVRALLQTWISGERDGL